MSNANTLFNNPAQYSPHYDQAQSPNPLDTSLAFQGISNLTPSSLDYGQYQTPPSFQQRMSHGDSRNQSPAFQHPAYQVNQVIPAKRSRPGEDHVSASPQPAPGMLGVARSQTPQQSQQPQQFQSAFSNMHGGQSFQTPNPYQHLQSVPPQSSPSPALSNQPGVPGQRAPSASPHPFAGGTQNYSNYAMPPNGMNHINGGQGQVNQQFMRNMQMGQPYNQRNVGNPSMMQSGMSAAMGGIPVGLQGGMQNGMSGGLQNGMQNNPNVQFPDPHQQYKMRLQQAQEIATAPNRHQTLNHGQGLGSPALAQNGHSLSRPGMPQQQQDSPVPQTQPSSGQSLDQNQLLNQAQAVAQAQAGKSQEQSFFQRLAGYSQQHNIQLTQNPRVCGRPVNLYQVFATLTRLGILMQGPNFQKWGLLAQALGFSEHTSPTASSELRTLYQTDLAGFVRSWYQLVQKRKMQMLQQDPSHPLQMLPQQGNQLLGMQPQPGNITGAQSYQMQMQLQQQQQQQQQQAQTFQTQPQQMQQLQQLQMQQAQLSQAQPQPQTHQQQPVSSKHPPSQKKARPPSTAQSPTLVHHSETTKPSASIAATQEQQTPLSPTLDAFPMPRKPSIQPPQTPSIVLDERRTSQTPGQAEPANGLHVPVIPDVLAGPSNEYIPRQRSLELYGGLPLVQIAAMGEELSKVRPGMQTFDEMGIVDIHAITLSVQSGIHGEVRYALDQLVSLSSDARCMQLSLIDCGDLVDTLLECAEDQLEILTQASQVISEEAHVPTYEELARASRAESETLQDDPEFASPKYELRQAVDRLLAVTTILRNISFADSAPNHDMLASGPLIPFIASTVKLIGTYESLLRTAESTLGFFKDCVTLLSNICHRVELPSKEDACGILLLLISFAPMPPDMDTTNTNHITFVPYDPKLHQYLPSAIDALAKLLARDEPNRTHFKSIFASNYSSYLSAVDNTAELQRKLLLTRAFALAIAPIPDRSSALLPGSALSRVTEARSPFLCQGMLAADILSHLCPGASDPSTSHATSTGDPYTPPPSLAQAWLESEDGWAKSLLHMTIQLASESQVGNISQRRDPVTGRVQLVEDPRAGFVIVVQRGAAVLARLAEKCDRSGSVDAKKPLLDDVLSERTNDVTLTDDSVTEERNETGESGAGAEPTSNGETATEGEEVPVATPSIPRSYDIGIGFPFTELAPRTDELFAALGSPTFDPVTLRSLLILERLVA